MGDFNFDVSSLCKIDEVFSALDIETVQRYVRHNHSLAPKLLQSQPFLESIVRILQPNEENEPLDICWYPNLLFRNWNFVSIIKFLQAMSIRHPEKKFKTIRIEGLSGKMATITTNHKPIELKRLILCDITTNEISSDYLHFISIKELIIRNCSKSLCYTFIKAFAAKLEKLSFVNITQSKKEELSLVELKCLRSLTIEHFKPGLIDSIFAPDLSMLSIKSTVIENDKAWTWILQHVNITKLLLPSSGFHLDLLKLPKLEEVQFQEVRLAQLFRNNALPQQFQNITKLDVPHQFLFNRSVLSKCLPNLEFIGTSRFILDGLNPRNFKKLTTICCDFANTIIAVSDTIPEDCTVSTLVLKNVRLTLDQVSGQTYTGSVIIVKEQYDSGELQLLGVLFPLIKQLRIQSNEIQYPELFHLQMSLPGMKISYEKPVEECDIDENKTIEL